MAEPPHPVLAIDKVRHVGDPVAVVIANPMAQARDAAELVSVDYAEEPAVADPVEAFKPGAPQVRDEAPGNLCYDWHLRDLPPLDAAIGQAAPGGRLRLTNNRPVPHAIEPPAANRGFHRATRG